MAASSSTTTHEEAANTFKMEVKRKKTYNNYALMNTKTLELLTPQLLKKKTLQEDEYVYVAEINKKLVLTCKPCDILPDNQIAIHYLHADSLDYISEESVSLTSFTIPESFELKTIGLEIIETAERNIEASCADITKAFREQFKRQIFSRNQLFFLEYEGVRLDVKVSFATLQVGDAGRGRGQLSKHTQVYFFESAKFKIHDQKEFKGQYSRRNFRIRDIEKEMLSRGVGGLHKEMTKIVTDLIVPRYMPRDFARETQCKYKQGVILHGPPGTGKTLFARALASFLNAKIHLVKGPELFSRFTGESESNTRKVFQEAFSDLDYRGDESPLHVIVFDELDAIARERGINPLDTTADRVVNQLLSLIDGYTGLTNVLLIGTTNMLELIDKSLLRPGRLELHLAIGLPDYGGRFEILKIYAKRWQWTGILDKGVNLQSIARRTEGYSGAALRGMMQSAYNNAMRRCVEEQEFIDDTKWENLRIIEDDFPISPMEEIKTKGKELVD